MRRAKVAKKEDCLKKENIDMEILPDHRNSFLVSQDRPDGVKLQIMYEDGEIFSDLRLDGRFNSENGVILSGILFGIMDVMMWCAILVSTGKICATHTVKVDFIEPVEPDKPYRVTGRFIGIEGRDVNAAAYIKDGSGNLFASVNAAFRENKDVSLEQALKHFFLTGTTPELRRFFKSLLDEKHDQCEKVKEEGELYPYGPL